MGYEKIKQRKIKEDLRPLSVKLPESLWKQIEEYVSKNKISKALFVETVLSNFFAEGKDKKELIEERSFGWK